MYVVDGLISCASSTKRRSALSSRRINIDKTFAATLFRIRADTSSLLLALRARQAAMRKPPHSIRADTQIVYAYEGLPRRNDMSRD